jgi:hypothetical protein
MPSSTSSSDIPYRVIPEQRWGLVWLICTVLVVLAVAGWESRARSMQHLPGDYNEYTNMTAHWAEQRARLDQPDHGIRVVLLGSSRMLWNADLDILEQALGHRPLQLSIAGTSPALMLEDIVENTDFDGLVLVGVTPFLFNRLDGGFFGADALRWYREASPSELSGHAIHAFLSRHFGFLDDGFTLSQLLDHYSQLPEREGALNLAAQQWKLGRHFADRQTDMWGPVEVEGSFDNEQILAFWRTGLGREPEEPERMAEMATEATGFFAPLVKALRARGGDAVFIRMPSTGGYLEHDLQTRYRELTWQPMADNIDAVWINSMDYLGLSSELEVPEWSHLSRKSQDDFSRAVVPVLERYYLEARGRNLHAVIDGPRTTE